MKHLRHLYLVVAALILALAVWQFAKVNIGNGIMLVLLTGVPVFFWFISPINLLAFWYIRKSNMEKAQKVLSWQKYPEGLRKNQEAYYYYLNGLAATQSRSAGSAETYFKKAISIGLGLKQDEAVAKLNLAAIYISQRKKRLAINMLSEAKKADEHNMMKEQFKMVEMGLKRI